MEAFIEESKNLMRLYDENTGLWKIVKRDKETFKSLGIIEETLMKLGLSKNEARVYLFLARAGEKKASEISEALSSQNRNVQNTEGLGKERSGFISF